MNRRSFFTRAAAAALALLVAPAALLAARRRKDDSLQHELAALRQQEELRALYGKYLMSGRPWPSSGRPILLVDGRLPLLSDFQRIPRTKVIQTKWREPDVRNL